MFRTSAQYICLSSIAEFFPRAVLQRRCQRECPKPYSFFEQKQGTLIKTITVYARAFYASVHFVAVLRKTAT